MSKSIFYNSFTEKPAFHLTSYTIDAINIYMKNRGLTLTELLIALALLGIIATFTIPKLLFSNTSSQHNASAKEVIGMIKDAYYLYQLENTVTASTLASDFTPYMNFIDTDSTFGTKIDHRQGMGQTACNQFTGTCYYLHNGGVLRVSAINNFGGTGEGNYVYFIFDPVAGYSGTTDTNKAVIFDLRFDGRVTTSDQRKVGDETYHNASLQPWSASADPKTEWFSWD